MLTFLLNKRLRWNSKLNLEISYIKLILFSRYLIICVLQPSSSLLVVANGNVMNEYVNQRNWLQCWTVLLRQWSAHMKIGT